MAVFTAAIALLGAQAFACLPNQIDVGGGVCETVGGHSSERDPYEIDAISGLDPEGAFLTELEEVEEYVDISTPNAATTFRLDCPIRPDCRQKPENENEKRCGQRLPVPMTNPWTSEREKTPRLAEYDAVSYLDMTSESHTCIRLRGQITSHAAGHLVGPEVEPGSRLQIEGTGENPAIRDIWGFPGSLRVDRVPTIHRLMPGLHQVTKAPVPMTGEVRISGPTNMESLEMSGELYLEEVTLGTLVLEGKLHLVNSTVHQLVWKLSPGKFFVGSCKPKKGCRGKYKILRGDQIPRSR